MLKGVNPAVPPPFDATVPAGGYRWWYVDAVSEDGRHALVIILFVGSVFSPYYFRARRGGVAEPEDFCAINVALYGPGGRWCMTERRAGSVTRDAHRFRVGPSTVHWNGTQLVCEIRERAAPFGQPLRGRVTATPGAHCDLDVPLDAAGRHHWTPWAPRSTVSVDMERPDWSWRGSAYLDANHGEEPLERAFRSWDWSRTAGPGDLRLHYEVRERDGRETCLCYDVDETGAAHAVAPDPVRPQRPTGWRVARAPRTGHEIARVRGLEDTPFYSRTLFEAGEGARHTVHESLDLDRFASPWVRLLLPFRMPREVRSRAVENGSD